MSFSKVILVVGCSRGIGKNLLSLYSQTPDYLVLALSRSTDGLESLSPHNNIRAHKFDLESPSCRQDAEAIVASYPQIDVVVNMAGAIVVKPFLELTKVDLQHCYDVNILGVMQTIQAVVPKMLTNGGHIVNISTIGGFQGSVKFGGLSAYSTSKAAMCSFTELFAEEFKETKIKTNCLCLGAVQTEMLEQAFPGYKAPVTADRMAAYVADFSLKAHEFMNGKILPVSCSTP